MTPTTPTGQRIVTRLLDTIREWDDEAESDTPPERRREARSRVACLSEVLRWLPREVAEAEREAVRIDADEDSRLAAVLASVPGCGDELLPPSLVLETPRGSVEVPMG